MIKFYYLLLVVAILGGCDSTTQEPSSASTSSQVSENYTTALNTKLATLADTLDEETFIKRSLQTMVDEIGFQVGLDNSTLDNRGATIVDTLMQDDETLTSLRPFYQGYNQQNRANFFVLLEQLYAKISAIIFEMFSELLSTNSFSSSNSSTEIAQSSFSSSTQSSSSLATVSEIISST